MELLINESLLFIVFIFCLINYIKLDKKEVITIKCKSFEKLHNNHHNLFSYVIYFDCKIDDNNIVEGKTLKLFPPKPVINKEYEVIIADNILGNWEYVLKSMHLFYLITCIFIIFVMTFLFLDNML